MDYKDLVAVLIAVIGSTGLWNFASKWLENNKKKKRDFQLAEGLKKISQIYKRMEEMEKYGAERVVLFAGHNAGGIPRLTCGFWVSSIFSHIMSKYSDRSKEYNNIPVDSTYVGMLLEAQTKPYVRYIREEMDPCQLKKYYESEGVDDSIIIFLGIHENKFMYMSIAKYDGHFKDTEVTNILLEAQNIKSMFDSMDKGV